MDTQIVMQQCPAGQQFDDARNAEHVAAMDAFDGLMSSVRHEMIVYRTRQSIEAERVSTEPLPPVQFPGRLLDCQVADLAALRSDVATIHYTFMVTGWLCRREYTPAARAEINRQCATRVGAVLL